MVSFVPFNGADSLSRGILSLSTATFPFRAAICPFQTDRFPFARPFVPFKPIDSLSRGYLSLSTAQIPFNLKKRATFPIRKHNSLEKTRLFYCSTFSNVCSGIFFSKRLYCHSIAKRHGRIIEKARIQNRPPNSPK